MINADFYPTPAAVVRKMLAPYETDLHKRHILEPSAGKGDILDALKTRLDFHVRGAAQSLYAIESDPELIATLTGKGYRVLSHDFLTFTPSHIFDLIVMNPPFSDGARHLLHAWNILDAGDIVCLLNAETLLNPCTRERKLLLEIVREHGEREFLGPVFADAERKTGVPVVMVRLHKAAKPGQWTFDSVDKENVYSVSDENTNEIALKDNIGTMIDAYEAAKRAFADVFKARKKIERYCQHIGGLKNYRAFGVDTDFLSYACTIDNPVGAYNFFVEQLRMNAWDQIFTKTGIQGKVTESVRKDFDKMRAENGFDFTEANIVSLMDGLMLNSGDIMKQCVLEAFDLMTKYYNENRIHIEGWKTNDRWMVSRKVILPYAVETKWGNGFRAQYRAQETLNDIDKACCFLSGKSFEVILPICKAIEQTQETESEFFKLKSHYKGTLHLTFLDEKLWERFNATAVDGKNWLPNRKGAK
jgi:predicted RNA methylase